MSAGTMTSLERAFSDALSKATGQEPRRVGNEWKGLCPAHGDRSPSLDFHEENGKLLIVCRSRGCKRDDVLSAARWNPPDTFTRRPVRARFPYHDEKGNELAVKIRFDDTDEAGKKCMFDRKLGGKKLPLYRLPEVLAAMRDGRPVYVAEGEKDADTLRALGLAATSAPYGAVTGTNVSGKWLSSYTDTLAGADVVLLQDADEAGAEHVRNVVRLLAGRAESLRIVPPFPGPKGTDVTDWLGSTRVSRSGSTRHTREELLALVEAAPERKAAEPAQQAETTPPPADAQDEDDEEAEAQDEKPLSAAAVLIAIGRKAELLSDERGDGYAAFDSDGVRRVLKMRSADFTRELQRCYSEAHDYKRAANGEALAAARAVLEALATNKGERVRLTNRFARLDGAIYLDTADARWRAIKITPGRWELIERPPILFRRYAHQLPLPEPVRGGNAGKLTAPFALSESDRLLVLAWAAVTLVGDIPRPVLCTHGPQGSGKTTLLKMLLGVLDPSGADDLDLGSEPRELAQVLDSHAVCFFDNLTKINEWQARLLCKAATGGGFEKRRLYSDEDSVILTFKRAVCFTGINVPTFAPDLLDRTLLIQMERMEPEKRRQEADLWRDFEAARPEILGGLLDALAEGMKVYPTLDLHELPRMADFATWGAAVSEALGFGKDAFLKAYMTNVSGQVDEILESDPVARAVLSIVEKGPFTGTAEALFSKMKETHADEMKEKDTGWPRTAAGLGKQLRVLHATLNDAGVTLSWDRSPGGSRTRTLTLGRAVDRSKRPSQPSRPSRTPVPIDPNAGTVAGQEADMPSRVPGRSGSGFGTGGTDGTGNQPSSPLTPEEAEEVAV